jgi:hypothetical protein
MASAEWNTGEKIRDHELATSIINRHGEDGTNFVFDAENLETLRRFCLDPTLSNRKQIMQEEGWVEADEDDKGAGAAAKGSLVGYAIVKHGTDEPVFDERDLELLKQWYVDGMPAGENVTR